MTEVVKTLLDAAQLPATDEEVAAYAAGYESMRISVDTLYATPAARYADPALRFRAAARIERWA